MSAFGGSGQTVAGQNRPLSAVPKKRTNAGAVGLSAKCQQRTSDGQTIFFKIDYFDKTLMYNSPDPSDPAVTERVITIMLADEY